LLQALLHRTSSFQWQRRMLVAMLVIWREQRYGAGLRCSEVMTGWRLDGDWNQSQPRATPPEGPPLAKERDSGRTHRHSQGPPPGTKTGGKDVKLRFVTADTINTFQLAVYKTLPVNCRCPIID